MPQEPDTEKLDESPYAAPKSISKGLPEHNLVKVGIDWAVLSTFPIAALEALLYRFPVPLAGYLSGLSAVVPALISVLVYGTVLGGFILLAGLGAGTGYVVKRLDFIEPVHKRRVVRVVSVAFTALCLFVLSILDKLIGPW